MSAPIIQYEDDYLSVVGEGQQRYIETKAGTAQCVPLTDSLMVIFVVEPSPAYDSNVLLLPGGVIEPGETAAQAANRELQEEIGYRAERLDYLGRVRPWEKYLHNEVSLYMARDLIPSKLHGDELYEISTELVPLDRVEQLIAQGRLRDSTSIAALYMTRYLLLGMDRLPSD